MFQCPSQVGKHSLVLVPNKEKPIGWVGEEGEEALTFKRSRISR